MPSQTVADEAAVLVLLRPSHRDLVNAEAAIDEVLGGIVRDGTGWRVDPSLAHVVRGRCPGTLVRAAERGKNVVVTARAMLSAR